MANNALTLIFLFVGVFLLVMIVFAGIAAKDHNQTTNLTDTQDTDAQRNAETLEQQKPFVWGLSGFQMILMVILILGGIAVFVKMIFGKRK